MTAALFLISISASVVGAIIGAGGGVIIKPVVDALGLLSVSTASFCSGCTVLCMSISSLLRMRKSSVELNIRTSTFLGFGAVAGGIAGKFLFELIKNFYQNESVLGAAQSLASAIINFLVFLYVCNKDRMESKDVQGGGATLLVGSGLGFISSFLGIGGGTTNVAGLFYFFSMDAKTAAKNSLYIILFSQGSNLITALATHSVPHFMPSQLLSMVAGGVCGGILGATLSAKIDNAGVEWILKFFLILITAINIYNTVKFILLI